SLLCLSCLISGVPRNAERNLFFLRTRLGLSRPCVRHRVCFAAVLEYLVRHLAHVCTFALKQGPLAQVLSHTFDDAFPVTDRDDLGLRAQLFNDSDEHSRTHCSSFSSSDITASVALSIKIVISYPST